MVTHEDWVVEMHRLGSTRNNAQAENSAENGWFSCYELSKMWQVVTKSAQRKVRNLMEKGKLERAMGFRPITDGQMKPTPVYRSTELSEGTSK